MQQFTTHAQIRSQQRGISSEAVDVVLRYGSVQRVRDGRSYYMDRQAHQRARRAPESDQYRRHSDRLNFYIIVGDDGEIVTIAHNYGQGVYRRRKPRFYRGAR